MRIGGCGGFSRAERFGVRYADALVRFRVRFAGRISGEGAAGTLRMRARVFTRNGRRLITRCDTGTRSWTAGMLRSPAPAPGGAAPAPGSPAPAPTPTPQPRNPVPGQWSLNMTSDPGDYIGQGRTWSHGAPADGLRVSADRRLIAFNMDTNAEFQGGWWTTEVAAPPGQDLAVGKTYQARRYPLNDDAAGFNHSGNGRGCNTLKVTFIIHEPAYDPDGTLRAFRADFEQHCEGGEPALRGTSGVPRRLTDSSGLRSRGTAPRIGQPRSRRRDASMRGGCGAGDGAGGGGPGRDRRKRRATAAGCSPIRRPRPATRPLLGIVLQPRGGQIAARFDT